MRSFVTVLPVLAFSLVARSAFAVPAGADEPLLHQRLRQYSSGRRYPDAALA